jgi:hypothetical protein
LWRCGLWSALGDVSCATTYSRSSKTNPPTTRMYLATLTLSHIHSASHLEQLLDGPEQVFAYSDSSAPTCFKIEGSEEKHTNMTRAREEFY